MFLLRLTYPPTWPSTTCICPSLVIGHVPKQSRYKMRLFSHRFTSHQNNSCCFHPNPTSSLSVATFAMIILDFMSGIVTPCGRTKASSILKHISLIIITIHLSAHALHNLHLVVASIFTFYSSIGSTRGIIVGFQGATHPPSKQLCLGHPLPSCER